jgi:hypothetical protein
MWFKCKEYERGIDGGVGGFRGSQPPYSVVHSHLWYLIEMCSFPCRNVDVVKKSVSLGIGSYGVHNGDRLRRQFPLRPMTEKLEPF